MWGIGKSVAGAVAAALLMAAVPGGSARAQDDAGFQGYAETLKSRARAAGVRETTIAQAFAGLTMSSRVVELDRGQPDGPPANPNAPPAPYAPYRVRHLGAALIQRGRDAYLVQRSRLRRIEAETGVPESIMVGIWGNETGYGAYAGNFDLLQALATLAYDGRRRAFFEAEFIAALKMIDRGVPRGKLVGSWAGATGGPQFMPSSYLRFARDGDGDGKADIWTSDADTLASIANYFVQAGWRRGQPWGIAVNVPAGFDRGGVRTRLVPNRCPRTFRQASSWRSMREWKALGLVPQNKPWPGDDVQATLLEPDGPGKTAYLLTSNYRVILDYNCTNFYALTVGLLADAVAQ